MHKTITADKYLALLFWLKNTRQEHGLSMRDLARLLDEPHQLIGKIETAERRLDVYEYVQYCEAVGVDPKEGLELLK